MANESTTVSMNVSLPEQMKKFVDSQVSAGTYGSVSEFIREAIREKRERVEQREIALAELVSKLEEGSKGPWIEPDADYWNRRKAAFLERFKDRQARA